MDQPGGLEGHVNSVLLVNHPKDIKPGQRVGLSLVYKAWVQEGPFALEKATALA